MAPSVARSLYSIMLSPHLSNLEPTTGTTADLVRPEDADAVSSGGAVKIELAIKAHPPE
jgi:hypothetical protein